MKFVLIVIWLTTSTSPTVNKSWNEVEMQEFDTKVTCEEAARYIQKNSSIKDTICLPK